MAPGTRGKTDAPQRALAQPPAAGKGLSRTRVAQIQRSRLLAGAVRSLAECGYAETTVAQITSRARVSRRTFYELFANREECLRAVLDDIAALVEGELAALALEDLAWREQVRLGLWAILSFLEREPALARVCIVQALQGGPSLLEHREGVLARLAAAVDAGRRENERAGALTMLTAEGLVGAAIAVLHTRLLRDRRSPLTELHGELLAMIVLPYLGAAAARREQVAPAPRPLSVASARLGGSASVEDDPLEEVPMRLTYRTARVLEGVSEHPGASNRQVADSAGISDQGQVSKLLSRLERLGLLGNAADDHCKGEPNVWTLTDKGERVVRSIGARSCNAPLGAPSHNRGVLPSALEEEM